MWYIGQKGGFMARKILITSGKGGVGKTSVCAHLGYALSRLGQRVVCMDLDFGLNNLDLIMGVEDKVVYDVKDVLDGRCRVRQTIIPCTPTLSVIPSRHTLDKEVTGQNVKYLAEGLSTRFDYVLYDCPAGIDRGFHRGVCAADEVIVVVTPTLSSMRDGDKVISLLKSYRLKNVFCIVNRVRGDLVATGDEMDYKEIESILKTPVIGVIPEDDGLLLCDGFNLHGGRAGRAFKMTAANLNGTGKKIYDATVYYRGFYGSIRRNFRKKA